MQIRAFELPPIGTNAFLISDEEQKEAILIDAPQMAWESIKPILEEEGLDLKAVLLTHGHFDHTMGGEIFNELEIPLYGHKDDAPMFADVGAQLTRFGMQHVECKLQINHWLEQGQTITLLGQPCEIRHVPGHCPGNILFYFPREKKAFVGDALFNGSIGRTDLPGGNHELLLKSVKEQIYTLPDETEVYPGHGSSTTVGHEKQTNPFVRG
jgi:glyoxylase-like metal-dependent hydrolase (beta-lactamase superfamily II)